MRLSDEPRLPLSKKLFPVRQVAKGHSVGRNSPPPPYLLFYELECTGGKGKKQFFVEKMKKKEVPVGPF